MEKLIIYKYPLTTEKSQKISMPKGASILALKIQYGEPYVWVLCSLDEKKIVDRTIEVYATGEEIAVNDTFRRRYLDTFLLHGGSLVLHAFEVRDEG